MRLLRTFPCTFVCIALTWYLCLMRTPTIEIHTFLDFDKIVHICMYLGTCSVFWVEYYRSPFFLSRVKLSIFGIIVPILMSGAIELIQEYFTTCRTGDIYDFIANNIGVLIAFSLSPIYKKLFHRKINT